MLRATVSGSFHRHMAAIYEAVGGLRARGVEVLSPSDPRVVDHIGEFLFVASDRLRSIRLVQDRHLEAINASDFLWVVCPDGYTGPSTCMEIGAAQAAGVPVYSSSPALDITLGEYVTHVPSLRAAVDEASAKKTARRTPSHVLLHPSEAIEQTLRSIDGLKPVLVGKVGDGRLDAERGLKQTRAIVANVFGLK